MAKNDELKRKLKAANKRRARRPEPMISPSATIATDSTASNQLDVAGLCVQQILKPVGRSLCKDAEVVSVLRECLKAKSRDQRLDQELDQDVDRVTSLHTRIAAVADRDDVSVAEFRCAISSLLKTATQHEDRKDDSAFMRFLTILAS